MNWQEVCEHPSLRNLPFKIELDQWGKVIMSPTRVRHGNFQSKIVYLLDEISPHGELVTECAIKTDIGTKVADVAWFSSERWQIVKDEFDCSIAPELCVEILSPGNTHQEMMNKKAAYFQKSAQEFWICNEDGGLSFYNAQGCLSRSLLFPDFPAAINK